MNKKFTIKQRARVKISVKNSSILNYNNYNTLKELLDMITIENIHSETNTNQPIGMEIW